MGGGGGFYGGGGGVLSSITCGLVQVLLRTPSLLYEATSQVWHDKDPSRVKGHKWHTKTWILKP